MSLQTAVGRILRLAWEEYQADVQDVMLAPEVAQRLREESGAREDGPEDADYAYPGLVNKITGSYLKIKEMPGMDPHRVVCKGGRFSPNEYYRAAFVRGYDLLYDTGQ